MTELFRAKSTREQGRLGGGEVDLCRNEEKRGRGDLMLRKRGFAGGGSFREARRSEGGE